MTKSEEINQILHKHIKIVFKDAINYKELIQDILKWNEKQLSIHGVGCGVCGAKEVRTTKIYKPAKKCTECGRVRLL